MIKRDHDRVGTKSKAHLFTCVEIHTQNERLLTLEAIFDTPPKKAFLDLGFLVECWQCR